MKNRTQRSRRLEVGTFFLLMAMGLSEGTKPLTWGSLGFRAMPYILVMARVFRIWKWQRVLPVSSLDDRAVLDVWRGV